MFAPSAPPTRRTRGRFGQVHGLVLGTVFALSTAVSCAAQVRTGHAREGVPQVPHVAPVKHAAAQPLAAPPLLAPVVWRYNTASPLCADPIVTAAGQVVLATAEGYLHALAADGALLWNYTLQGSAIGGPVSDDHGRVYVATVGRKLYAIESSGSAAWTYTAVVEIVAGPHWDSRGFVVFPGSDHHQWAVSTRGRAVARLPLPAQLNVDQGNALDATPLGGEASGRPVFDAQGTAYVPLQGGEISLVKSHAREGCPVALMGVPLAGVLWFNGELLIWSRSGQIALVSPAPLRAACQ
ncbi:MAG TPA: PQQ-binding-like beta-propeller repeat protein [Polyangiaceae bacterium]|nr:PQQ-binding-like beta-propeller repeat protein [Polyangiaceae bacterium]